MENELKKCRRNTIISKIGFALISAYTAYNYIIVINSTNSSAFVTLVVSLALMIIANSQIDFWVNRGDMVKIYERIKPARTKK